MQKSPLKVTFLGVMPTLFAHCQHCMDVMHGTGMEPYSEQLEEYPDDIRKQYFELSAMAQKINNDFQGLVAFDAVDSASPQGVWLTLKCRILRTPCILINGRKMFNHLPSYEELHARVLEILGTRVTQNEPRTR